MKQYILCICSFFITTHILANHTYHSEGIVKTATGKKSPKVPVYQTTNSNFPSGEIYIRNGNVSGYNIGTLTRTTRKKTRKGTFTISTIKKSVIEDDTTHPLAKNPVSGATQNIIGFVRNPHYSQQAAATSPKNIPLYEFKETISSNPAVKNANPTPEKPVQKETQTTNKK